MTTNRLRSALAGIMIIALGVLALGPSASAEAATTLKYGSSGSKVRELQTALNNNKRADFFSAKGYTNYFGTVTRAGLKRWEKATGRKVDGKISVGSAEWKQLLSEARKPARPKAGPIDSRCKSKGKVLCISKTDRKLRYMINGKVQLTLDARFGSSANPTREGTFKVFRKVKNDWSRQYRSPMPYSMYFSGGEAVHYSSDFARRGWNGNSHGCVNTRDKAKLAWLYNRIPIGTKVVVYR
ncbi:MAG: L,D-transpeptidase family protein [Propionibacteriales bacterium]|nr:L,D-transpeptidase family protein [Propionibacteriales bacterium]